MSPQKTDRNATAMKSLTIYEDGSMVWTNFDDRFQQIGFVATLLHPHGIQAVQAMLLNAGIKTRDVVQTSANVRLVARPSRPETAALEQGE